MTNLDHVLNEPKFKIAIASLFVSSRSKPCALKLISVPAELVYGSSITVPFEYAFSSSSIVPFAQ